MDKRIWCIAVVAVSGLSLLGCGKKTTNTQQTDAGGVSGATAGTGGASGAGGGTAGAGGRGGTVAMNVPCAPAGQTFKCAGSAPSAMAIPGLMLAPVCCVDAATKTCGAMSSTGTCEAPPTPDSRCPSVFGGVAAGCCINNDLCGIDASLMGRGCLELGQLRMLFGGGRGGGAGRAGGTSGAGGASGAGAGGAGRAGGTSGAGGASGAGAGGSGTAGRAGGMGFTVPDPVHCDGTPVAPPDAGAGQDAGN